jgi:hypothetical protein
MEKYSIDTQGEIDSILEDFYLWKNLFTIKIEHFIDGWAIYLRELRVKPRLIVIFRSFENNSYSIRSYEIGFNETLKNEEELELYKIENLENKNQMIKELRDIIYGKDLLNFASSLLKNFF